MFWRRLTLRLKRQSSFYLKILIIFFIIALIFDKGVIENRLFRRGKLEVQKDLLNYNEDGLRPGWPFQITKHYDAYYLWSYTPKPKVVSTLDLPGERGDEKFTPLTFSLQ